MLARNTTPSAIHATGHVNGACYVYQHGVAERALREPGSTLDFGTAPERLLADLHAD